MAGSKRKVVYKQSGRRAGKTAEYKWKFGISELPAPDLRDPRVRAKMATEYLKSTPFPKLPEGGPAMRVVGWKDGMPVVRDDRWPTKDWLVDSGHSKEGKPIFREGACVGWDHTPDAVAYATHGMGMRNHVIGERQGQWGTLNGRPLKDLFVDPANRDYRLKKEPTNFNMTVQEMTRGQQIQDELRHLKSAVNEIANNKLFRVQEYYGQLPFLVELENMVKGVALKQINKRVKDLEKEFDKL